MTEQELQELQEKLAKFAAGRTFHGYWLYPDGVMWGDALGFTQSLDACYKHLVPRLLEDYNIESYSFKQCDNWYYSETNIWRKGSTKHGFEILHDEHIAKHFEQGKDLDKITALALCKAIEKLIDKEEK